MDEALDPQDERSALAAELALGLLEGSERASALRLQLSDPDFAAQVLHWEARLAPLHGAWAEIEPHDAVWNAVAVRIGNAVADGPALRRWQMGALASGALAAGLAVMLVMRPETPLPKTAPTAIAQMTGVAEGVQVAARYDPTATRMIIRVSGVARGALSPELWVIPAGGAPVSLGGVETSGTMVVPLSDAQRALLIEGATLAVTMEPVRGMPHAAPSSAPVAAGKISVI